MLKYVAIAILFIPLFGFAQQDYLVLHQGDTIRGNYIKVNGVNKYVRFRSDTGKIKIPSQDVKEVHWKNRKYRVYEDPCEGGFSTYRVLIEGKATFLHSDGYEDFCPDLIIINKEIYPLERRHHFSEAAWNILSKCPAFEEKYRTYYHENRNKTIVWEWAFRKSRTKCLEMIRYYNANCGKITP